MYCVACKTTKTTQYMYIVGFLKDCNDQAKRSLVILILFKFVKMVCGSTRE